MKSFQKQFSNNFFLLIIVFIYNISLLKCLLEIPITFFNLENNQNISMANETIYIDKNRLLYVKVKIGSTNQEFNLMLDTTSSKSWVTLEGSHDKYPINNHYNPDKSTTHKKLDIPFEINNAGYYCKGNYYEDEIEFIKGKKFKFTFGVASETKFDVEGIDGIIGLAYNINDENLSFLSAIKNSGITNGLSFSILLDEKTSKNVIYIGKHEDLFKNETISYSLLFDKNKNYWANNIESFALNNSDKEVKLELKFEAIFDLAANVIVLPAQYFAKIKNNLTDYNCRFVIYGDSNDQTFKLACIDKDKLPNFEIKINGTTFVLPNENMFYKIEEIYYSKILFNGQKCIIGTPFFSLYHTMFGTEEKEDKKENTDPKPDESGFKTIYLLYILLPAGVVIIGIIVLIVIFRKKKKNKENIDLGDDDERLELDEEGAHLGVELQKD